MAMLGIIYPELYREREDRSRSRRRERVGEGVKVREGGGVFLPAIILLGWWQLQQEYISICVYT